ncbi:stage III sporulation AC/AD family protein [Ruminococcus sp.]|uniref:stage III sporulation AC/AD family protein n=1 Tax=Ruminococcus sp. TaxID=41978 RepID=UPI002E81E1EC|nr:stage III sporulation AC/AD family protein [Ruminococcus sp.]MEE3492983.1 stage III sporulation AC/AD family protein [Ruminococcus sp.]
MTIITICGAAIVTAVLAVMLRSQSPHSAMLLSVAAGAIIILSLLKNLPATLSGIQSVLSDGGIDTADIAILLKVMGICFVTEFTCDCVTEAGLLSLSTNISFAGKILVLLTSLPLFQNIISVITTLGS